MLNVFLLFHLKQAFPTNRHAELDSASAVMKTPLGHKEYILTFT